MENMTDTIKRVQYSKERYKNYKRKSFVTAQNARDTI